MLVVGGIILLGSLLALSLAGGYKKPPQPVNAAFFFGDETVSKLGPDWILVPKGLAPKLPYISPKMFSTYMVGNGLNTLLAMGRGGRAYPTYFDYPKVWGNNRRESQPDWIFKEILKGDSNLNPWEIQFIADLAKNHKFLPGKKFQKKTTTSVNASYYVRLWRRLMDKRVHIDARNGIDFNLTCFPAVSFDNVTEQKAYWLHLAQWLVRKPWETLLVNALFNPNIKAAYDGIVMEQKETDPYFPKAGNWGYRFRTFNHSSPVLNGYLVAALHCVMLGLWETEAPIKQVKGKFSSAMSTAPKTMEASSKYLKGLSIAGPGLAVAVKNPALGFVVSSMSIVKNLLNSAPKGKISVFGVDDMQPVAVNVTVIGSAPRNKWLITDEMVDETRTPPPIEIAPLQGARFF